MIAHTPDKSPQTSKESGSAVIGVIIMTMISSMLVAGLLQYSSQQAKMTRHALDFQKCQIAAEAALEFGFRQLRREAVQQRLMSSRSVMQNALDNRLDGLNTVAGDFPAFAMHTADNNHTLRIEVDNEVVRDQTIGAGTYADWHGDRQNFTITAGARNPETGVGAAYQLTAQVISINLIRFAIFYEEDLEFLPGPPMELHGPVHTNADLYLRPRSRLELHDRVRTAGDFIFEGKDGRTGGDDVFVLNDHGYFMGVRNAASDGGHLDSRHDGWTGEALQQWRHERFLSSAHNVQPLRPPVAPLDPMIELIQRPRSKDSQEYQDLTPEERDQWQMTEDEKFSTRAAVTIHVDNAGNITATDFYDEEIELQVGAELVEREDNPDEFEKNEEDGHYVLENNASIDTSLRFRDGREGRDVASVDLYMDNLLEQLADHLDVSSSFSNPLEDRSSGLIYVTRDDPGDGSMPAVRLRNASRIERGGGISIASDKPVYIEGHFNRENPAETLVAGDAVSLLSTNWQDSNSSSHHNNRRAADTEHNLVFMTGNTETPEVGGDYGGGVENVYRYLENWSGRTHLFRGSLICLWQARVADSDWGGHYSPPNRDWGYDDMYTTTSPPGMIRVFGLEELEWSQIPYEQAKEKFTVSLPPGGPPDTHPGQGQGPDGEGPPGAGNWPSPGGDIPEFPFGDDSPGGPPDSHPGQGQGPGGGGPPGAGN